MSHPALRTTILLAAATAVWGQTGPNVFPANAPVGIGTASPSVPLEIKSNPGTYVPLQQWDSGNAGNTLTLYGFDVTGNHGWYFSPGSAVNQDFIFYSPANGSNNGIAVRNPGGNWNWLSMFHNDTYGALQTSYGSTPLILQGGGGRVGIGTTSPNYLLDVKGAIGALDVYVASNALPDYVFGADYRNAPLAEVAAYIEQNHHLPGIPSAADAGKNGLSVGQMQNKLLEKVEELTLHMIEAEKRSDELAQTNERLAQQNRELQRQMAELRAAVQDAAPAPARGK